MKTLNHYLRRRISWMFFAVTLTAFYAASAFAQTTAFTYQGRLTDSGAIQPTAGNYDLQFTLFDANGTAIGASLIREDVPVANGIFTVTLDFGAAFDGTARSLEIAVRRGTETGAFTALTPRQPFTSTPYAIQALNAANAATAVDATRLGGVAAADYLQQNGSGANLTNLNAGNVSTGTLDDARLSSNVAWRNAANTFTGNQTVNGNLSQTGTVTDLNLTNGFVARGAVGSGAIPATGAGGRMMFYPGKFAFRAGKVDTFGADYWDDANVGAGSIAFGDNTRATGSNSFAANLTTTASGSESVAFGNGSTASGERSFAFNGTASRVGAIAIGSGAQATGDEAAAIGLSSIARGLGSVAIGPSRAFGNFTVAIGLQSYAGGQFSLALGKNASTCQRYDCDAQLGATYNGVVTIGDGCAGFTSEAVTASANNQINIRGCGGFRFFTGLRTPENSGLGTISGVSLAPGGSQWLQLSDRNSKENFRSVNSRDVLQKVLKLPITTWNYKSQDASIRHIGAMAQDFKAAFEIGEDDKHISSLDPDGVAFAAIQGLNEELNERTEKLQNENKQLKQRLAAQERTIVAQNQTIAAFEARLQRLEQAAVKPRRRAGRNK